ncbi:MAG: ABC transporter permease subunit [Gaiellaceae bacterium]
MRSPTSSPSRRTSKRSSSSCTGRRPTTASELVWRSLSDHRRALAGWCAGIAAYATLIAAIFPSIESSPEFNELVESYPDVLKSLFGLAEGGDLTSGAGYLDIELFSFMLPVLVLVLAIGSGARAIAGEEDAGRLELVLSYPLRRRDAVLAKGAAGAGEVLLACATVGATIVVFDPVVGLDLSFGRLAEGLASLAALGLLHGWLALAVGAAVPSRALAIGVPVGLAAAGYLVGGLHEVAGWLDPFRFVSPFWLVGSSPLQNGANGWGVLAVLVTALVALVTGSLLVERRDLETP